MASERQIGDSADRFVLRLEELKAELTDIRSELASRNIIVLADRCRRMLSDTRSLLDGNLNALFASESPEVRTHLHSWLGYADQQIATALSQDYDFEVILQRLYMAALLATHVQESMAGAIEDLKRRHLL